MELECKGILPSAEMPEDLTSDYNPPKDPRKYVEHVEMVRWCGINERVSYELDPDEIQILTNQLQAEYIIRVTDDKYLSCRAEPSVVGSFFFDSTAYDCPKDGTRIELGEGLDKIIHPRNDFMVHASVARQYAEENLKTLDQKLEAFAKFRADPCTNMFAGLVFGSIPGDREILSLSMLDTVAMKFQGTRHFLDDIAYLCDEQLWDVVEGPQQDKDENAIQLRHIFENVVQVAVKDIHMLDSPNPLDWVAKAAKSAAGKKGKEMLDAMAACHPTNQQ